LIFLFQAEDGIRDDLVTGVQTCALPISRQPGAQDVRRRLGPGHRHPPARHLSLRPGGAATDGAAALRQAGLSLVELGARQPRARSEERRVGKEWTSWG